MYVDDNGIVRFENTDDLSPLHVQLNIALQSISDRATEIQEELDGLEPDQITFEDHYLRVGEDGAPRLWADPELVHGREYTNAAPAANRNRLVVVTQFGTFGTLAGMLDRPYLGIASGRVTVPISNNYGTVTVTFPAGRFTSTPRVMVTPVSAAGAGTDIEVRTSGASATGFTLRMARSTNADTDAEWFAVAP